MKNTLLYSAAALVATSAAANAQSIDYQVMGEMFGEPVTLGATGAPQRASDVPASMIIITRNDIDRYPAEDIADIVSRFIGVDAMRTTRSQVDVSIRGYDTPYNPRLLVLLDGRQVYLDYYSYVDWRAIPVQLAEIEQIEIVKGPQAALYGFNAVSGVINIITRNPSQSEWGHAEFSLGLSEHMAANGSFGHQISENTSVRASFGVDRVREYEDGFRSDSERFISDIDPDRFNSALMVRSRLSESVSLMGEATYTHERRASMIPNYVLADEDVQLYSVRGGFEAETGLGLVTGQLIRNDAHVVVRTTEGATDLLTFDNGVTIAQLQTLFKPSPKDTVRLGFEYRDNSMKPVLSSVEGDTGYTVLSGSVMWSRKLNSAISLTGALRYDYLELERTQAANPALFPFTPDDYDQSVGEFSYNLGLVWAFNPRTTVRFTTGRGVQVPSLVNYGLTVPTGPTSVLSGSPDIDPTIDTSYEIAVDRKLGSVALLRASAYYNEREGIVSSAASFLLPPASPLFTILYGSVGDSSNVGFELSLEDADMSDAWRWYMGITHQTIDDDYLNPSPVPGYPTSISTPELRAKGNVGWSGHDLHLDVFAAYQDGFEATRSGGLAGNFLVDVDASFEVSAKVRYDLTEHLQLSVSGVQINYGDGEVVNNGPEQESRIFATLRARF